MQFHKILLTSLYLFLIMNFKRFFISFILISFSATLFAAKPSPVGGAAPLGGGPPAAGGCWPPPCVPIDGGISLLIAAGAVYGGRKLYQKYKESKTDL